MAHLKKCQLADESVQQSYIFQHLRMFWSEEAQWWPKMYLEGTRGLGECSQGDPGSQNWFHLGPPNLGGGKKLVKKATRRRLKKSEVLSQPVAK